MTMSQGIRLICLGLTALDVTWSVDELPRGGGKTLALGLREEGGGMAANAAVAAARLGASVSLWARAGDDSAGRLMRDQLARFGVDVSGMRLYPGARSSVSGIIVDRNGERSIVNFRGEGLDASPAWLPLEQVRHANVVLADPRWPEGALALFAAARDAGVPTVLDADRADASVFDHLLPLSDHAVFSEQGLADCAGDKHLPAALAHARAKGCGLAGVTRGEAGLAWLDDDGLHDMPAFRVDVRDTTGAGDAFHGAFAMAIGAGWPVRKAMRFSAAVAALKCTSPGARDGLPDFSTVQALLQASEE